MSMESNSVAFEGDDLTALVSMMEQLLTFHEDGKLRRLVVTVDDDFREGLKFKLGDVHPVWTRGFGKMAPAPERMAMDGPSADRSRLYRVRTNVGEHDIHAAGVFDATALFEAQYAGTPTPTIFSVVLVEDQTGVDFGVPGSRTGIGPEPEANDDDPRGWRG